MKMKAVVRGYLNYFAINDNSKRIAQFVYEIRKMLFKWLNRRSQKKSFTWGRFNEILKRIEFPVAHITQDIFFSSSAFERK